MPANPPPSPPASAADAAPTVSVPAVDLGPTFEAIAFVPGRYAVAIQLSRRGTHARQRVSESSTMSLVLDLSADGAATACRGWDYAMSNAGPKVRTEDRFREQQGFRGRYLVRDGVAEVELAADDDLCPRVAEYTKAARRSSTMKLRCVRANPRGAATLSLPVLLCEWFDADTAEVNALRVRDVAPRPWMLLGSGNGVRIKVTGAPPTLIGDPTQLTIEPAAAPIDTSAWQHPF